MANYDFEGIFFDMTFWPTICYCPHCIARYRKEQGAEPPRIVDWKDPQWRAFQKSRERWLREFALSVTQTVKQTRPIPVYHQFGTVFAPWTCRGLVGAKRSFRLCSRRLLWRRGAIFACMQGVSEPYT